MKKILFFASIFYSLLSSAQITQGKVVYERIIKMQFRGNMPPELAANMPKEKKDRFELSFANNQSLWESIPDMDENNENGDEAAGNFRVMRFGGGDDLTYHNFGTGKSVQLRELNAKNYVVEDSIQKLDWKLTEETKTVLGYKAQLAKTERYAMRSMMTMENGEMKRQVMPDTTVIIAWIAMDIPVPAGPEFQGQLPGLVLELDINHGQIVYNAVEISAKVNPSTIKEPKGGKHITIADFNKERERTFEEMQRNMPPGRQLQIVNH